MHIDWLDAHYHFSFANYHDPERMGLGPLRVINDDIVRVGGGFDFHGHRDMEIITYVRKGAITHKDSLGNVGVTATGEVQVMSAGTGIRHAELNAGDTDINLYQIWIEPRTKNLPPRWEMRHFPDATSDRLTLLVSGLPEHAGSDALTIDQDAALYGGHLAAGTSLTHPLKGTAYLLVSKGEVRIGEDTLHAGDGAIFRDESALTLTAITNAELVLIDLPLVQ